MQRAHLIFMLLPLSPQHFLTPSLRLRLRICLCRCRCLYLRLILCRYHLLFLCLCVRLSLCCCLHICACACVYVCGCACVCVCVWRAQVAEIDKLNSIINVVERDMVRLKKQYEQAVEERNYTGMPLIQPHTPLPRTPTYSSTSYTHILLYLVHPHTSLLHTPTYSCTHHARVYVPALSYAQKYSFVGVADVVHEYD